MNRCCRHWPYTGSLASSSSVRLKSRAAGLLTILAGFSIRWFQLPLSGFLASLGVTGASRAYCATVNVVMWRMTRKMCGYCRCLRCWPACKMSFARQVMVRIWLADAPRPFACVCCFALLVLWVCPCLFFVWLCICIHLMPVSWGFSQAACCCVTKTKQN